MYLEISGNNQIAQARSVCVWNCRFFPGGQLAPPVLSWVSRVTGGGSGSGLFTWKLPWCGSRPGPGELPLPGLPSTCSPAAGHGGPGGGPGRFSVAALGLGWRRATCHMVLGAEVVRRSYENSTPPRPPRHHHQKNMPVPTACQQAALSGR